MARVRVSVEGIGGLVDCQFDDGLTLGEVLRVLADRGLVSETVATCGLFRSTTSGRVVSARRPLVEEWVLNGDLLVALVKDEETPSVTDFLASQLVDAGLVGERV